MAHKLGVSQASYARIESGTIIPKIDRLQRIADILEVDLSTLLSTTNNFHFIFNEAANQSGYINSQTNHTVDIELIKKSFKKS
ncbi:MAG: helix-turn-helix transcriptional regulator [Candidatus Symbiothrix sp.]|nr:helix-turn-helix transcriptional regulator [Candidatus Symbiothrix sp.]